MNRVTIIGVGLIGGSLAMALKRARPSLRLAGVDRPDILEEARRLSLFDETEPAPERAVSGADLVVLATSVGAIVDLLSRLGPHLKSGALVTDVGSTKRRIAQAAESLPPSVHFIGGHPMAGKAESGLAAAACELFQGAPWALVPRAGTPPEAIDELSELIRTLGAEPILTDATTHDRAVAVVSHLPQLLALVLCEQAASVDTALELAGPAFRSLARLASSPFPLWEEILESNQDWLRWALAEFLSRLSEAGSDLGSDRLGLHFAAARAALEHRLKGP